MTKEGTNTRDAAYSGFLLLISLAFLSGAVVAYNTVMKTPQDTGPGFMAFFMFIGSVVFGIFAIAYLLNVWAEQAKDRQLWGRTHQRRLHGQYLVVLFIALFVVNGIALGVVNRLNNPPPTKNETIVNTSITATLDEVNTTCYRARMDANCSVIAEGVFNCGVSQSEAWRSCTEKCKENYEGYCDVYQDCFRHCNLLIENGTEGDL